MTGRSIDDLSAGEVERLRTDYAGGAMPVRVIATTFGITPRAVYQMIHRLGLTLRRDAQREAREAEPPRGVPDAASDVPVDLVAVGRALERRIVEHLLDMQTRAAGAPAARAEILSKAIAHQTRALRSIREWTATLSEDDPTDDTPPPRDLGELRDELRRHLERIRAEQRGPGQLDGGSEPT